MFAKGVQPLVGTANVHDFSTWRKVDSLGDELSLLSTGYVDLNWMLKIDLSESCRYGYSELAPRVRNWSGYGGSDATAKRPGKPCPELK